MSSAATGLAARRVEGRLVQYVGRVSRAFPGKSSSKCPLPDVDTGVLPRVGQTRAPGYFNLGPRSRSGSLTYRQARTDDTLDG